MAPFEWLVGMRYTRSGRKLGQRNGFISFIAALSVAGIALGVAALIIVLSVMNGFQKEVRDRMLSVLSHIEILADAPISDWRELAARASLVPHVTGAAPFVGGQVVITRGDVVRGAMVRGIDPEAEPKVSEVGQQMRHGTLQDLVPGRFNAVVGSVLADQLGLVIGDRLALIAPEATISPAGIVPRMRQFTIVGIFESGHYEYDSSLVLTALPDAARLFRVDGPTGLRLKTDDMQAAPQIAREVSNRIGPDYIVRDWSSENRVWFSAVQVEKRMMFIILTLIIAVAAFNLVSMLVMTVTDKRADIAILRTLGASPRSILSIFMIQGTSIGVLGTIAGVLLGVLVSLNIGQVVAFFERAFGFHLLPPGIYVINELPSDLRWPDVGWIAAISCVLAVLATIYPSLRASRVRPAEALRYE